MHSWGSGEGRGRDHARGPRDPNHPARMQDVREDADCAAKRAGQRVGDWPQNEPPRRELGEVGQQRGNEIAEVQLAGLHELAHRVLGRLEGTDEALADIATDVAGLVGAIRQRCRDRLPAGEGSLGRGLRRTGPRRGTSGIAKRRLEPLGRTCGLGQRIGTDLVGAVHGLAQRLPAFEGCTGPFRQLSRGPAIQVRGLERAVRRIGQAEIRRGQRVALEGPVEGRLCCGGCGGRRALEAVLYLAEVEVGHQRDAELRR